MLMCIKFSNGNHTACFSAAQNLFNCPILSLCTGSPAPAQCVGSILTLEASQLIFMFLTHRNEETVPHSPFLPFDVQGQSSRGGGHGGLRDVGFSGAESCSSLSNVQEVQIRL